MDMLYISFYIFTRDLNHALARSTVTGVISTGDINHNTKPVGMINYTVAIPRYGGNLCTSIKAGGNMSIKPIVSAVAIVCAFALLAGCSTAAIPDQSSSPTQQSGSAEVQQTTTQATGQPASQQPSSATGPQQPPKGLDMTAVLTRAAEILGVTPAKLITAFENARSQGQQGQPPSGTGGQQGQPPSGTGGQRGQPPSGSNMQGGQPPAPPSDNRTPLSGPPMQDMTAIYTRIATELGLSATDVANAMEQAQKELMK